MGLFCVSMHFRTSDDQALVAALSRRAVAHYRIASPRNGWTSLYEQGASEQNDEWIRELAGGLSADLHVAAISFLVHDSDVACYWLFDDGRLVDQYNSCPGYFDEDDAGEERAGPAGGRPDILVRYCRTGVPQEDLTAVLEEENLFADSVIERLARALGIDPQRALADYRDAEGGDMPDRGDESDDDGAEPSAGPNVTPLRKGLLGRLARMTGMFGTGARNTPADPQATALVEAATHGDTNAIGRLLDAGVAVDMEASIPLPSGQPPAGLGRRFPHGAPQFAMTPLLAAITHKQPRAAERLLDAGADPNRAHPLFGTPVHAAAGAGEAGLLQLLLDRGGDPNVRNARGQTPLDIVAAGRATRERLAQVRTMMESMGRKDQLPLERLMSNLKLPLEGWDACERLLKARGAQ